MTIALFLSAVCRGLQDPDYVNYSNIRRFKGCTKINGNIIINDATFHGQVSFVYRFSILKGNVQPSMCSIVISRIHHGPCDIVNSGGWGVLKVECPPPLLLHTNNRQCIYPLHIIWYLHWTFIFYRRFLSLYKNIRTRTLNQDAAQINFFFKEIKQNI